ncbi:MAG: GDP-mannose 4,6-dehydratase, partial [Nanoarchaeota archaeon]
NPKIKIIFPSTVTVAGDEQNIPANEKEMTNPLSIYDTNKLAAENYLNIYFKNYGINFSCLRLSNVFGERQKIDNPERGVVNFMIGHALHGEKMNIYGDGNWIRDYSYMQNFVDAFVLAAESKKTNGETYVLGSGEGRTFNEVISTIGKTTKEFTGRDIEVSHIPFPEGTHQINKRDFIADSSKFRLDTGWEPKISFEEGIRRTIDFYRNKK